ncbi:hypothetical protein NDU88_008438 [Pleurodeles waltl]|uniref:Uncharacterized protein n=1 Tax=Pleurodeles waltl TaxID=8319 RepID=A0AAV7RTT3_PLEWA|nr:hypothetical protein NDU88_008438 [Pleurodeles waltl]
MQTHQCVSEYQFDTNPPHQRPKMAQEIKVPCGFSRCVKPLTGRTVRQHFTTLSQPTRPAEQQASFTAPSWRTQRRWEQSCASPQESGGKVCLHFPRQETPGGSGPQGS